MRATSFVSYLLVVSVGIGITAAPAAAQTQSPFKKACFATAQLNDDQIIHACSTVIRQRSESGANLAAAYYNRGHAYYAKNQLGVALQDFDQSAILLRPDYATALGNRCFSRTVLGQLEAALADCTTARRLDPNNAAILDNLGLTYLKVQRPDQALADSDEALKLDPQKARALFGRDVAGAEANFAA